MVTLVSVHCPVQLGALEAGVLPLGRLVWRSAFSSCDELILVRLWSFGDAFLRSPTDKVEISIGFVL